MGSGIPFIPGTRQFRINVSSNISQLASLVDLVGPRRQERLNIKVRAQLVLQDADPLVLVLIQQREVGYLSSSDAQALHRIVRYGVRSPHEAFECAALIHGTVDQLGVRLDLPIED
jgi:hypothetical protein